MVLIGGGLHCTAAAALPEALLPSAGVTDCLACNLSCIYLLAEKIDASQCECIKLHTEMVITTAQQGCSTQDGAAFHHAQTTYAQHVIR